MSDHLLRLQRHLDHGFSWQQLIEIGWGIENGLFNEQITTD